MASWALILKCFIDGQFANKNRKIIHQTWRYSVNLGCKFDEDLIINKARREIQWEAIFFSLPKRMARPERKSTRTAQKAKNRRHAAAATEFWYRSHRPMRGSHQKPNEIRTGHCLRRTAANENVKARHRRTMASPKPNNQKKKQPKSKKKTLRDGPSVPSSSSFFFCFLVSTDPPHRCPSSFRTDGVAPAVNSFPFSCFILFKKKTNKFISFFHKINLVRGGSDGKNQKNTEDFQKRNEGNPKRCAEKRPQQGPNAKTKEENKKLGNN